MYKIIKYKTCNEKMKKDVNILHLSDIHYMGNRDNKLLDDLYKKIKNYKLDYIIITGDIIDCKKSITKEENKNKLKEFFEKISRISKVIISYGNHDMYGEVRKKFINEFDPLFWKKISSIKNITILNNNSYEDKNIYVYGYTPSIEYYYPKEKKEIMLEELTDLEVNKDLKSKYNIFLIHSPFFLDNKEINTKLIGFDLILSGHMHNGLMPPVLDEIIENNKGVISRDLYIFPNMTRGYVNDGILKIISSGINKVHSYKTWMLNFINVFYPRSYNVISIKNKKCKFTIEYKYEK